MSLPTFYYADLHTEQTFIELSTDESSHAVKSRRLKSGQKVCLLNGAGLTAEGTIAEQRRNRLGVNLDEFQAHAQPARSVTIATAVPKGDRQRVMVDMLSQHAVTRILPLNCDYSVTRFNSKLGQKWQRYAVEACKQSQNPWLPEIAEPLSISELPAWMQQNQAKAYYADKSGDYGSETIAGTKPLLFIIGPEGGFSPNEFSLLQQFGVQPIKLAETILRTEAAAINALIQARTGGIG